MKELIKLCNIITLDDKFTTSNIEIEIICFEESYKCKIMPCNSFGDVYESLIKEYTLSTDNNLFAEIKRQYFLDIRKYIQNIINKQNDKICTLQQQIDSFQQRIDTANKDTNLIKLRITNLETGFEVIV